MKVKELIKRLKEFPKDEEIYISTDSEGNTFKVIDEVDNSELGKLIECAEKEKGAIKIRDQYFKWILEGKPIVIFPTDECINNN